MTLTEFFITEGPEGVTLRVRETGFENLDADGMAPGACFDANDSGEKSSSWPKPPWSRLLARTQMRRQRCDEPPRYRRDNAGPGRVREESTRSELILRLGQAPASASGLQHELSISRQGIMKHLEILREAGLVSAERDGRAVVYQLAPARLGDIAAALEELSRG
ncbi:helix-turn-helix domain-containing protein [Brevibacterium sp. p3-SID960]|uniref:helix-turn-helix domain-containing protein n=1 Tax=Brevibacterium sp. p3-SID960 TaxID=2916063 RepID=UPI0021A2A93E|nr:helix-turn-helix domain-containing protein [Brevibacterium sp. p3-SID960]MCT1691824.1 helix-turn-helix domain-containing protein [Brevibacterium sp. p3-SID960]